MPDTGDGGILAEMLETGGLMRDLLTTTLIYRESTMPEPESSLFDRLGGAVGVAEIVREMYQRVLADPELAGFFENVSLDRLHQMQFQFMAAALDGPVDYTGAELTSIHRGRGITGQHFAKFCVHFADAAEASGARPQDVDVALGRLAIYKDQITGEVGMDG